MTDRIDNHSSRRRVRRLPASALVAALVVIATLPALLLGNSGSGGLGSGDAAPALDPLRAQLARALAGNAGAPGQAAPAARRPPRDRAARKLRRAARRANKRFMRDGVALLGALDGLDKESDAGFRRLTESSSRLRSDAADLLARFRAVKPHRKRTRAARRKGIKSLRAAIAGLGEVRGFAATADAAAARGNLTRAEEELALAERLARSASRRLGCRRGCGSGF